MITCDVTKIRVVCPFARTSLTNLHTLVFPIGSMGNNNVVLELMMMSVLSKNIISLMPIKEHGRGAINVLRYMFIRKT